MSVRTPCGVMSNFEGTIIGEKAIASQTLIAKAADSASLILSVFTVFLE